LPSVSLVESTNDQVRLTCQQFSVLVTALIEFLGQHDLVLSDLSTREATLDDVFIHLTGKRLESNGS
jgi:ABC-2 type transport system ATP-binding protein